MDNKNQKSAGKVMRFAGRHRRKLWMLSVVVVIYTLAGFLLVPWLVEKLAVDTVRERYAAELKIEHVAFNPYVLSLRIDGLSMRDPRGEPFAGAQVIYANLQLSSIFRLAPTFAEIRLDEPEAHLSRGPDGEFNAGFLAPPKETGAVSEPEPESAGPPRLIVHEFAINEAALHWRDAVPIQPVETVFGPVNVAIRNLNTLPEREGQQDVVITTETAGVFSWSGSLQLNPLHSVGRAQVLGSHMLLVSAYIRDAIGFEMVRGDADFGFDYTLETAPDGSVQARVDNAELGLRDLLVRTFGVVTATGQANDRDVLVLPELNIRGGSVRWPEQSVKIDDVAMNNAALSIHRDVAGTLNILPRSSDRKAPADSGVRQTGNGNDWSVSLDRFSINSLSAGLIDDSVQPPADIGIDDLTLTVSAINTDAGTRFPAEVSIVPRTGGSVRIDGEVGILPDVVAELSITAHQISLAESHPYLKPLADVNLDSGNLSLEATVTSNSEDGLTFAGDIAISDFLITETDEGSTLGSWDRLTFNKVVASLGARSVEVSEVRFDTPYADIFVAEDGSINLGRVQPGEQVAADPDAEVAEAAAGDVYVQPTEPPFDITIGRVVVADAAANFADYSLPLPFEAGIANLNGQLTTIATASIEPSKVDMEGTVDEFGLLRVSGTITPLDVPKNTDIRLRFQNVEIPKFSAYSVAFAGRQIASGKLDLDLGYAVTNSQLVGENSVVLRDFVLGEKIEHPGAMSLPLGLAVALLKGPDGNIDLSLPVRGNVDDPEFGYGRVIGKALVNLVVKIAASPFALLGNLIGAEAEELDHISFITGRSDLTPPEQERVAKIGEALGLRPELVLEINGVFDREADGVALRTARLDALVESRIDASSESNASDAMYSGQRAQVIESLYREAAMPDSSTLNELQADFTTSTTDPESGRATSSFDTLAYTAELRRQLIELQTVPEEEIVALAKDRADNVRSALVTTNERLADRFRSGPLQAVEVDKDGSVRMDVALTTRENN